MSVQIAVRLPEDVVAFVDGLVADGDASSRAEVVRRALERERRRAGAASDAAIYAATEPDEDIQGFIDWVAKHPPHVD